MRDPKRIKKILDLLEKVWTAQPQLRFCQLIGNIISEISTCTYCQGKGYFFEDNVQVGKCLRCLGSGSMSNVAGIYHLEDTKLESRLEDELRRIET